LCLGNFRLARFPGVAFDLPHLNGLLRRLRFLPFLRERRLFLSRQNGMKPAG
jgi:hypothetical protein